ncbi:uncharacterized protein [Setaria viridis]|uniref:uncharacterized protein n=1 Tax=Setaria viridis TaxID=4556 RepID=UPI0014936404|nr:uncharacterized protein LOC117844479 [Setaria viridis]
MEAITRREGLLVEERVDDAKADGWWNWKKTDMVLLGKVATALHLKKIDELDQVNRTRKMAARDLEDQGLVSSDADDEQLPNFARAGSLDGSVFSASGPSRAVVLTDPVTIEVELKVKGNVETEDKDLSLLAVPLTCSGGSGSSPFEYTSKLSTMEFMLGEIASSVEATVFVRVTDGSWTDGFRGQFAARTSSIGQEKVILLDFGDGNVIVNADGIMKLSRHVVSVDVSGKLKVSFKAWQDGCKVVEGEVVFTPAKAGRSYGTLRFGSCRMEVLVAWSLISREPEPDYLM